MNALTLRVLHWLGLRENPDSPHGHAHSELHHGGHHHHGHHHDGHDHEGHGHTHGVVDPSIAATAEGIRAVKISFLILAATAALQLVVVFASGSVALLADTIHNIGDATTALPLWLAFATGAAATDQNLQLRSRPGGRPRRHRHRADHPGQCRRGLLRGRSPLHPSPPISQSRLAGRRRHHRLPRQRGRRDLPHSRGPRASTVRH